MSSETLRGDLFFGVSLGKAGSPVPSQPLTISPPPPRYFRQELERLDEGLRKEDMAVHVRRDHVFEDSYRELHRKSPEDMKNRL